LSLDFEVSVLGCVITPVKVFLVRFGFCLAICLDFGSTFVHQLKNFVHWVCIAGQHHRRSRHSQPEHHGGF
jgi:hypothetical protein